MAALINSFLVDLGVSSFELLTPVHIIICFVIAFTLESIVSIIHELTIMFK